MEASEDLDTVTLPSHLRRPPKDVDPKLRNIAVRTAFIARFIVLREGRRSRAHRLIEQISWEKEASAQEVAKKFLEAFLSNGDKLPPVKRDLKRALLHGERSVDYFIGQYVERATLDFHDALADYVRSNKVLFGEEAKATPRRGGWRLPHG